MIKNVLQRGHHPHIAQAPALTRKEVAIDWGREARAPISLPLLREMWEHYIVDGADAPTPDPGYVRQLKTISPKLSVHWLGFYKRWGHFLVKKAYWLGEWRDQTFVVIDEFPMLIDIVQTRDRKFMPLSQRTLPVMDMHIMDMHKYLSRLRDVQYYKQKKYLSEQDEILKSARKDLVNELKRMYGVFTGDTPRQIITKSEGKLIYEQKKSNVN